MNYEIQDEGICPECHSHVLLFAEINRGTSPWQASPRSGTSVGANYREACRSRSKAEFIAKLGDCLKELDESGYWFELLEKPALLHQPVLSH